LSEPNYVTKLKSHEFPHLTTLLGKLDIELTERCNNACIHCLINQPEHNAEARGREMDTDFVKDILLQAADLGCLVVRFTGGEPLLRDDFAELYIYARRLGLRVILFTNARRLTPELAQLLKSIPPGRPVEVTVYGMHPESYDTAAATRGAFAEFWRGLELLREYGILFVVKQSLLPQNRGEMEEFEAFAASLSYMRRMPKYTTVLELRARRDSPTKNRFIESLRLTPEEIVTMMIRDPYYIRTMRQFAGKFLGSPGDKLFSCGAGDDVCVDAYGQVQMCMGLRHPEMVYDLRADHRSEEHPERSAAQPQDALTPLKYALTEFFPRLRELRATNPEYLKRCARCFLKGLCEQCPAKAWQEHGTLDTPVEYLCEVAHAQARSIGLLEAHECSWEIEPEVARVRVIRFANIKD